MNIKNLREEIKNISNPIIIDYLVANDLLLYAISNSYFRDNLCIADDYRYLFDKKYPLDLINLKINVSKYKLNVESIKEIVTALNLANKKIKINVDNISVDQYDNYIVTLSFYDNYHNIISKIRYTFFSNYIAKKGLRNYLWVTLPYLKIKAYLCFEVKELSLARNIFSLLYENSFILNKVDAKRMNYLLSQHISQTTFKKAIDLELRFHSYKKEIFINDLNDILNEEEIKNTLDINRIKSLLI